MNIGGPKDTKFFLQNAYNEWLKAEAEGRPREREVDQFISAMFETIGEDETTEAVLPHILPIVRNRRELEGYCLDPAVDMEQGRWDGAYQPMCHALAVGIAIDRPSSLVVVDSKRLREWGAPFASLLDRAIMNLRERSPTLFERQPEGFYVSQYNDNYDCSRLLIPQVFELLSLKGEPVAIAIARNGMAVAGSHDSNALLAMARFAEEQIESATRPTSYLPLVRKDGGWVVFEPEDPSLQPICDLAAKQKLWDNEQQRAVLEAHCASKGRDVYVASILAGRYEGRLRGIVTWAHGVPTLLPPADAVALTGPDDRLLLRSWDDFFRVCGDVLVDEKLYPVRYLTPDFLDHDRLVRLECEFQAPPWFKPAKGAAQSN